MIVSSLRKLISTKVTSKQKHGMSKVFQQQDNIVEENLFTDEIWAHTFSQKNVIIIAMAFGKIISVIQ